MHAKVLTVSLFASLTTAAVLDRRVNDAVAITVPAAVPSGAPLRIDPDFAGFAFEERSFYLYFGMSTVSKIFMTSSLTVNQALLAIQTTFLAIWSMLLQRRPRRSPIFVSEELHCNYPFTNDASKH